MNLAVKLAAVCLPALARSQFGQSTAMEFGRLIRVSKSHDYPKTVAYIVAAAESRVAIDVIKRAIADPDDQFEDLGRVSGALLKALGLSPGEFLRADGRRAT